GAHRVMVLSDGLWKRAFGADPNVLGRRVPVGTESYEVVGVMPPGFSYPDGTDVWTPLARTDDMAGLLDSRNAYWLSVVGRLAPGVDAPTATAELEGILRALEGDFPGLAGIGAFVEPLHDVVVGDVRPAMLL